MYVWFVGRTGPSHRRIFASDAGQLNSSAPGKRADQSVSLRRRELCRRPSSSPRVLVALYCCRRDQRGRQSNAGQAPHPSQARVTSRARPATRASAHRGRRGPNAGSRYGQGAATMRPCFVPSWQGRAVKLRWCCSGARGFVNVRARGTSCVSSQWRGVAGAQRGLTRAFWRLSEAPRRL